MSATFRAPQDPERKPLHTLLPLEQPLSLFIDPCDACNFRCGFCFRHFVNYRGNPMKVELFKKIVNDMQEFDEPFKVVYLYDHGEPLINPHLADFIRMLKEKTVAERVSITTNASLLSKEKSRELIDAGLDKIDISIYALNDEGYFKFSNAKISFSMLYENIQYLYSIKGKCQIHTKIAGEYFSEEEKELFLDKFSSVSDTIYIDHATDIWPGLDIVAGGGAISICIANHSQGKKYARYLFTKWQFTAMERLVRVV